MSQVLSMYESTSAGMDIGVARMPMTTLQKRPGYHLQEIHSDFDSVEWQPATTRRCRCSHANTEVKLTNAESTCLERPGRIQLPEDSSSGSCMFSDHHMDNLTSQLHLLNIEILQILRPLRSAAHEDNPLSSCLSFPVAYSQRCQVMVSLTSNRELLDER